MCSGLSWWCGCQDANFGCKCRNSDTNLCEKKKQCAAQSQFSVFHPESCKCQCSSTSDFPGAAFATKQTECENLGGSFDAASCNCLCTSHEGVFHGAPPSCLLARLPWLLRGLWWQGPRATTER